MGKDHELLEAARTGNISIVEKLLHSKSKSSTFAASLGIRVGANVNCQDQNGYTPLHHASLNGHSEIVVLLLKEGASVNTPDNKGSFPLHLAAWNGISDIVNILLTTGPSFANVNDQNGDKETPLHCSAQHGHQESVKILLENHADPELRNIRDESALDLASQYGRLEVVRLLLMYHPKLLAHSPERFAPLHLASRNGHREVVELLLVHGADLNKVGANGTALHEAALFGKYGVVSLLLKRGADPSAKDSSGRTSLELVSQLDTQISRDIAKLIIARIQDGEDYEPLRSIITSTPNNKPADIRATNMFDKPTNVFATISGSKVSRNLSRSFGEADLASNSSRGRPSYTSSLRFSRTSQLSPESTKSHRIRLRRTSSARSARSLPRLASTASYAGNRSLHSFSHGKKSDVSMHDWSIRQHHPSIDMFPVTPTRASQTSRKTSASEPSSPHLGFSSLIDDDDDDTPDVLIHDTPFRGDDDCVFFPGTPTSGRPQFETFLPGGSTSKKEPTAILSLKPPAVDKSASKFDKKTFTKPVSVLVTQPSQSGSEVKLALDLQSDIPPPLPRKMSASPPCGIEPKSPVLKKNSLDMQKSKIIDETKSDKICEVVTLPRTSENQIQSQNSWSSHSFTLSESSEFSPTIRSPSAPQKPHRFKPDLTPPPLPPKPAHMVPELNKKIRPPSPSKPPPSDDEEEEADMEEKDGDIFEDSLSLSSIEGTQVTTPTFNPNAFSDQRFRNSPEEEAKEPLSPPSDSNHSGSTSTVIFVSSPTGTIAPESGNTEIDEIQSGVSEMDVIQSGNTQVRQRESQKPVNEKHLIETESGNSKPSNSVTGDHSTTSFNSGNLEVTESQQKDFNSFDGCQNFSDTSENTVASIVSDATLSVSTVDENLAQLTNKPDNKSGDNENNSKSYQDANFSTSDNTNNTTTTSKTQVSSPTLRSPSPPFSPPSPNTAMLQVSSALQKAKPTEKSSNINTVKSTIFTKTLTSPINEQGVNKTNTKQSNTILEREKPQNKTTNPSAIFIPSNKPRVNKPPNVFQTEKIDSVQVTKTIPTSSNLSGLRNPNIITSEEKIDPPAATMAVTSFKNTKPLEATKTIPYAETPNPTRVTYTVPNPQDTLQQSSSLTRTSKPSIIITVKTTDPHGATKAVTAAKVSDSPGPTKTVSKSQNSSSNKNILKIVDSARKNDPQGVKIPAPNREKTVPHIITSEERTNIVWEEKTIVYPRKDSTGANRPYITTSTAPTNSVLMATPQLNKSDLPWTGKTNISTQPINNSNLVAKTVPQPRDEMTRVTKPDILNSAAKSNQTQSTKTISKPFNELPMATESQISTLQKSDLTRTDESKIVPVPSKPDPVIVRKTIPNQNIDSPQSASNTPQLLTKTVSTLKAKNDLAGTKEPQVTPPQSKSHPVVVDKTLSNPSIDLSTGNAPQFLTKTVWEAKIEAGAQESQVTALSVKSNQAAVRRTISNPIAYEPQNLASTDNTNLTNKLALPKKRFSPIRQQRKSIDNSFIKTSSQIGPGNPKTQTESGNPKTDKLGSKSMTNLQSPTISIEKPSSTLKSKSIHIMSPKPYENSHKSAPVRHESKNQMRPQSELYYTATEVKRARICSTRSVIEIPLTNQNSYSEYDNFNNENQIARNKRSSSLGPQVKTLYQKPKAGHVESEVQTMTPVRKVIDAYTQTYPPKFSNQRKLSLQKSRSVDVFHKVTPKSNEGSHLRLGTRSDTPIRPSNFSVKKTQKPVPKIKPTLVTTPPSVIRAKRLQKPVMPAKPAHLLNYKPSIKSKEEIKGKENIDKDSMDLFLNENVSNIGLDDSFHSVTSAMDSSPLTDNTAISVLSLNTSTEDWNDALSDRTEDMRFPTLVRKYRGLIRGSSISYRSKFSPCTARDPSYDSDEFEYDYQFDSKAAYSRVNASLQPDDEIDGREFKASVTKQTKNSGSRQGQNKDISIPDNLMGEKCNIVPANKTKNYTGEPGEKRRKEDILLPNTSNTVTSQEGFINYAHSRDSSYDNNNNNNNREEENLQSATSTTSLPLTMTTAPILSSPMSEGLPDFGTIVDTVTAVRKKTSPQGSTSGVSSTSSSQSSTLAKQEPTSFNENDEWAQIANVMKSVGNTLNKGSVYAQEFEETFWRIMTGSNLPTSVAAWLSDLNLSHYEEVIFGNGFDNINFLASDILAEQDLVDMNIQNSSHRRRMLDSAKNLPKIRLLNSTTDDRKPPSSVGEWLRTLALGDHEELFISMGFNTLDKVSKMRDTEIAGIVRLRGHRKRIRASIGQSSNQPVAKPRTTQSNTRTTGKIKSSPPLPRSPLLDKINFFKDYSQKTSAQIPATNSYGTASSSSSAFTNCSGFSDQVVPIAISEETETTEFPARINRSYSASTEPYHQRRSRDNKISRFPSLPGGSLNPQEHKTEEFAQSNEDDLLTQAISRLTDGTVKKSGNTQEQNNKENMSTSDSNEVRVPDARRASYLSSNGDLILRPPNETTEEEVTVSSWCHDPEVLIKSCCNYQAYYLGSMLVHEVKGVQSTVEACAKMKKSTDSMKKIPTVTLSISYKGVKFIDSKSKHEIAEHEIHNISFASQDAEDLSTLAYITRDARTDNHYCHVFRVTTLDVAYEIILTLGQAFEVAYQLILKEKETQKDNS